MTKRLLVGNDSLRYWFFLVVEHDVMRWHLNTVPMSPLSSTNIESSPAASTRKGLLFVRGFPISYHTLTYTSYDVPGMQELSMRLRRDLVNSVYERLERFHMLDRIVVYYDEGQHAVTRALHEAFDYMLGDGFVEYKKLRYQERRLSQVADYLSSVELAAMRCAAGTESETYREFYGLKGDLKRNYLKQIRRKLI